jgi:2'-5' RNA ligase
MDANVRAFVAIELPADERARAGAAQARARELLGPAASAVRWVDPAGLHLTLKFLGAVPAGRIPEVIAALERTLAGLAAFPLAVGPLGVFPGPTAPRVVWLAVLGDRPALLASQEQVETALVPLGYPTEKRGFQPHLTLARVRDTATPAERAAIGRLPAQWPKEESRPFTVRGVSLMQSHLGPAGARYTRLAEIPMTDQEKR